MPDSYLVSHCSPTLAGLKTGNIFTYRFSSLQELKDSITRLNRRLSSKGIRVIPLRIRQSTALIYVFRPKKLSADLSNAEAEILLQKFGYSPDLPGKCILRLIDRLKDSDDFPHEIGLFLGYPPEDVHGFICHKNEGCKTIGCWKVYGDKEKAENTFKKFKKCKSIYSTQLANGNSLERLTVRDLA